jgi:ABC-type Fe3+ transport system permease subunit
MEDNPYTPGSASKPKTRASRRWLWAGFTVLAGAAICIVTTVIGMIWSVDAVARSSTAPEPSDLASGVSNALIPSIAATPLAILGFALLIVGFIRREPVYSE